MDAGGDRAPASDIAVIKEIYENDLFPQCFAMELEKALENRCSIIVIEPSQLGDETARWITVGNYIHNLAVASGLSSILTGFIWSERCLPQVPFCVVSTLCASLYTASWQFDHCVKYQVDKRIEKLAEIPILSGSDTSPVVLVRRDNTKRIFLQWTVTLGAAALCAYRLYHTFK